MLANGKPTITMHLYGENITIITGHEITFEHEKSGAA